MNTCNRPKQNDEKVINEMAEKTCDLIIEWLKQNGEQSITRNEILQHCKQILKYNQNYDGYQFCKRLDDDFSYEPDSELVDALDQVPFFKYDAHKKIIVEWIKENKIEPKFKINDTVNFNYRNINYKGLISKICNETAQYVIFCEKLGHVKKGAGTNGIYFNWEDVDSLN